MIPNSSPFGGEGDPFVADATHKGNEIARAVAVSVEPYRKELEAKSELLNDAVEMVKTRNTRIREVESLLLRVQKDLWSLEVVYDEEKEDYLRSQADRKRLKQQLEALQLERENASVVDQRFEKTLKSLSFAHQEVSEIWKKTKSFEEVLKTLHVLEAKLDGELKRLGDGDGVLREMGQVFRDAVDLLTKSSQRIQELEKSEAALQEKNQNLDQRRMELKSLLRDAIDQIETVK